MGEITHVEKPVCDHAKSRGLYVRKCAWIGRQGAPDRLFYGHGTFFFVEFKDTGEVPEPHQEREIKRMRDSGIPVFVIDNPKAGRALIDQQLAHRRAACGTRADLVSDAPDAPDAASVNPGEPYDPAAEFF